VNATPAAAPEAERVMAIWYAAACITWNALDALEVVQAKIDLGIPPAIALAEVGYREEDLAAWGIATESRPVAAPLTAPLPQPRPEPDEPEPEDEA
jgi:hypothetical protein